jgi:hypothetical protein
MKSLLSARLNSFGPTIYLSFLLLPQGQQAGIGGEWGIGHLDLNGQWLIEIEVEEGRG